MTRPAEANRPRPARRAPWLHRVFEAGLALKGVTAALEFAIGALMLLFGRQTIAFAGALTPDAVAAYPKPLAACLVHLAAGLSSGGEHFYALFFLVHGLVKGLVVVALVRRAPHALPFAIAVLSAFVIYQLRHYLASGSVGLLVVSAFDLLLIYLILREYRPAVPGAA